VRGEGEGKRRGREEEGEVRARKGRGQPPEIFWPRTTPAVVDVREAKVWSHCVEARAMRARELSLHSGELASTHCVASVDAVDGA